MRDAYTCLSSSPHHGNNEESTSDSSAIVSNISISLTPQEEKLFETLEHAAIAYENGTLPSPPPPITNTSTNTNTNAIITLPDPPPKRIEIRIAGGWVRDKILNHSSHDVDIALDSLSGIQFASIVQRYLYYEYQKKEEEQKEKCQEEQYQDEQLNERIDQKKQLVKTPKIAIIAANPNQSKHLETATMTIHSIDVDFVHLRGGEVYTSNSRIPTLKESDTITPLDDALRRDFTVNSLFYNLRKKQVEDYTGRGISDLLVKKALVTPIDANLTFHDDPLRVLRAIRFGVRYGLTLSEEIVNAAKSKEVHDSLHVKVSRERVGKELEGMLSGKNAKPQTALNLMTKLKLAGCVFCFPPKGTYVKGMIEQYGMDYSKVLSDMNAAANAREKGWEEATVLLEYTNPILQAFKGLLSEKNVDIDTCFVEKVNIRLLYLSIFLFPFRKLTYLDKKEKSYSIINYMIKESIKFSNKDVASMTTIMDNVDEMKSILNGYNLQQSSSAPSSFCRLRIGMVLRQLKDLWITTLLVAAISEMRSNNNITCLYNDDDSNDCGKNVVNNISIDIFSALYRDILHHNLDGCWKIRPLLDGKAIVKSLDLPRGPVVGTYLEEQVRWMLVNPNGTREKCEEHLQNVRKRELELSSSEGNETQRGEESEEPIKHCSKKSH